MSMEPPPFQQAARCDVCKSSFNTFKRRHHCRCCGRTLCNEHSSSQMVLPQFGIQTPVRVCLNCFNNSSRYGKYDQEVSSDGVDGVADSVSRLDIGADADSKTESTAVQHLVLGVPDCKCGMPLCICEAPAQSTDALTLQKKTALSSAPQSNPKPKKRETTSKNSGSSSNSKLSSVFNPGQVTNSNYDNGQLVYDVNGEGLREAIKNGDSTAVKKLLVEGVDANYRDKQGLSVLHLAAVFNQTDIAFTLMDSGASLDYKNAQGETPLDCAPATLQYKMRKKMEGEE